MAVDKLVDSAQLNADLTSVANAIRTKGGTSASLAFPADFVSAINAIQTGGGTEFASGSVTFASDYNTTSNHLVTSVSDIGFTPTFFFLVLDALRSGTQYLVAASTYYNGGTFKWRYYHRYSNTSGSIAVVQSASDWTTASAGCLYLSSDKIYIRSSSNYIVGGEKYNWIAVK